MLLTLIGVGVAAFALGFVVAAYAAPARLLELGKELGRRAAGMARRRVQAAGHGIAYFEKPGAGETVVLLHGFGANKDGWLPYARGLRGHRLIIPDLPGFGDSEWKRDERYGIEEQVARLKAFFDALQLGPVHLAGNSMGGSIAGVFAAKHPGSVKTLLLMDNGGVDMPNVSDFKQQVDAGRNPLIVRSIPDVSVLLDYVFHRRFPLPAIGRRIFASEGMARIEPNEVIFETISDDWTALEEVLDAIEAPTLLMWGEHDRILDVSIVGVMEPRLKQVRTVIYDDAGHLPYMEVAAKASRDHRALIENGA